MMYLLVGWVLGSTNCNLVAGVVFLNNSVIVRAAVRCLQIQLRTGKLLSSALGLQLCKCIYIASVTIKIGALQKPGPDPDSGRKIVLLTGRNLKLGGPPAEAMSVCPCVYPHIYFSLYVLSP